MVVPYHYPSSKDDPSTYYVPGSVLNSGAIIEDKTKFDSHGDNIGTWFSAFLPQLYPTFTFGSSSGHWTTQLEMPQEMDWPWDLHNLLTAFLCQLYDELPLYDIP